MRNVRTLQRTLAATPVSEGQWAMAWILFQANGLACALEFVNGLAERGLLIWQREPFPETPPQSVNPIIAPGEYQQGRLF